MNSPKAHSDNSTTRLEVFMNEKKETLFLVPTGFERQKIVSLLKSKALDKSFDFQICGFGPIAAAAKTMQLLAQQNPDRVVLLGIAGTYQHLTGKHPVATATQFDNIFCDGVGVGSGDQFQSATTLGWPQWADNEGQSIGDCISCDRPQEQEESEPCDLLTVCSASDNLDDAKRRTKQNPSIVGEDMEAFGVAMACRMFGVKFEVIRGFSNLAGDRTKSNWRIDEALIAAVELLLTKQ